MRSSFGILDCWQGCVLANDLFANVMGHVLAAGLATLFLQGGRSRSSNVSYGTKRLIGSIALTILTPLLHIHAISPGCLTPLPRPKPRIDQRDHEHDGAEDEAQPQGWYHPIRQGIMRKPLSNETDSTSQADAKLPVCVLEKLQ